jgi:hypothetical protein
MSTMERMEVKKEREVKKKRRNNLLTMKHLAKLNGSMRSKFLTELFFVRTHSLAHTS